ncbi:DUF4913 domain-containing protein [Cryobacterium sp. Y11]|uniref:DUF4913 domain-containing protein n=1 Tax=Cryobacterium sp. Y11 TaxID=2045016 RepID=UPI000CE4AEB0|nr:DUF4913 domain-containing protein [Cryobacterium sp. Y11]
MADDTALDDVPDDDVKREDWEDDQDDGATHKGPSNDDPDQEPDHETETTATENGEEDEPDVRQMFLDWLTIHLDTVEVVGTKPTPWCMEWWLHPEVVARFTALWHASMQASASVQDGDAGATSSWWINHWDRHAAVIFDKSNGPFRDCDTTDGHLSRRRDRHAAVVPLAMPPDNVTL